MIYRRLTNAEIDADDYPAWCDATLDYISALEEQAQRANAMAETVRCHRHCGADRTDSLSTALALYEGTP